MRYIITLLMMVLGAIIDIDAQVTTTDSVFINNSRPIEFVVDKIYINDNDRKWITDTLIPKLQTLGNRGIIIGRAAASPEGPRNNNLRLATNRRKSVDDLLASYGISTSRIRYDVVTEDYPLMRSLMWLNNDPLLPAVDSLLARYAGNEPKLKEAMKRYDKGKLWQHVLRNYFPRLRAVRIMAIDKALVETSENQRLTLLPPVDYSVLPSFDFSHVPAVPRVEAPVCLAPAESARRELLSVKSNLLFDFAFMPGYDRFCPIPNVAVEYYPLHGHFTYGASFDGPWWQHYNDHKYFQLRNYQLHARYYLSNGDISVRRPGEGAAFKGLFFSAYAHAFIYNICFAEKRGWEGEGAGAGLGIGYSLPLDRKEHWRLEFGMQAGWFFTDYDPYQWRCPVDPDNDRQLYYYKWYGDAKDFKKRQHRYTWLGPTRLDITLSYDLLYRKSKKVKR